MGRRIDIEPDDIAQLVDKLWIVGELEVAHPVRFKAMRAPDALDGACADTDGFRHHGGGPVGGLCWRLGLGERHDAFSDIRPKRLEREGRVLSRKRPS